MLILHVFCVLIKKSIQYEHYITTIINFGSFFSPEILVHALFYIYIVSKVIKLTAMN